MFTFYATNQQKIKKQKHCSIPKENNLLDANNFLDKGKIQQTILYPQKSFCFWITKDFKKINHLIRY